MRKNKIRKTKMDKVDTYIIAKTLMMQDSLRFISLYNLDLMVLKFFAFLCVFAIYQPFFKSGLLSEICLCANRGAYTKRYRFHAYDSSVKVHWLFIGITAFHRDTYIVPSR